MYGHVGHVITVKQTPGTKDCMDTTMTKKGLYQYQIPQIKIQEDFDQKTWRILLNQCLTYKYIKQDILLELYTYCTSYKDIHTYNSYFYT